SSPSFMNCPRMTTRALNCFGSKSCYPASGNGFGTRTRASPLFAESAILEVALLFAIHSFAPLVRGFGAKSFLRRLGSDSLEFGLRECQQHKFWFGVVRSAGIVLPRNTIINLQVSRR